MSRPSRGEQHFADVIRWLHHRLVSAAPVGARLKIPAQIANSSVSMTILRSLALLLFFFSTSGLFAQSATDNPDFNKLVEEYISGYLAARPLEAVSLGFHEYDGKLGDYSRGALDAELARLKDFDQRFQKVDVTKISLRDFSDLRLIRASIQDRKSVV